MTHPHLPSRRTLLGALAAAPAVLALERLLGGTSAFGAAAPSTAAAVTDVQDLGVAMTSINVRSLDYGTLPDGTPVAYALSSGEPVTFNVIDLNTGARLFAQEFPPHLFHGAVHTATDGTVYFNTREPSTLHRFHPAQQRVETIGARLAGEGWILDAKTDAHGVLYMSTYPGAKVAAYDPRTGEVRQYGSVAPDAAYAQTLELVDDEVWIGTGPKPHLLRMRPDTGQVSKLAIPAEYLAGTTYVLDLERRGDMLFVRFSPRGRFDMAVYDLRNAKWLEMLPSTMPAAPTDASDENQAYYLTYTDLIGYDLSRRRTFATGFASTSLPAVLAETVGTYGIHLTPLKSRVGPNVVGMASDGRLWRYNLPKRVGDVVHADVLGNKVKIRGVGVGPDGNVYLGAKDSVGIMARIDGATGEITPLAGPKQADAITGHGSQIAVSSYDRAFVHIGDLTAEWDWGINPRELLRLGRGAPYHQDRIHSMVSTGARLAVASIPEPGQLGGALTIVDTGTGQFDVHRNVVAGQSVVSVVHHDGIVYGGTSINGGLSTTPTATVGTVFAWDVAAGVKRWETVPVPGAPVIGGLCLTPDGHLWGMSEHGTAFELDPVAGATLRTVQVVPAAGIAHHIWGGYVSLVHSPATDGFYGTTGQRLFYLDRATLAVTILQDGIEQAVRATGGIYCTDTTNVFRIDA